MSYDMILGMLTGALLVNVGILIGLSVAIALRKAYQSGAGR